MARSSHGAGTIQGPVAAGQDQKRIRQRDHARFALVHGGDRFEARQAAVRDFAPGQEFRQHADHLRSSGERGIGERTHQSYVRASIHQAQVRRGDLAPEHSRFRHVRRIVSLRRSAVHCDAASTLHWRDHS
jgi:hypothetical protein